mgnify:CR=1 FL=1
MSDSSDRRVVLSRQELQAILTGLSKTPQRLLALPEVRAAVARHRFDRLKSERGLEFSPFEEDDLRTGAVQHNVDGLNALPALDRTAELVQPLLSLNIVKANINSLRVLSIGPRSEIELLAIMPAIHTLRPVRGSRIRVAAGSMMAEASDIFVE